MRILVVEDEQDLNRILAKTLTAEGYSVDACFDGVEALDYLEGAEYDAIVLDVMMPRMDGFSLLAQMRESGSETPVIFLTAKDSVPDRVRGLDAGADDYLVKPFDIVELIARVESVLRRTGKTGDRYTVGDVCIDARAMRVTRGGEPVLLTPKEFDLLLLFVQNRNIALFRETIYERVWGTEFTGDSRTVDLHVQRLRRKLDWQGKLLTIYKTGYRLEVTD